MAALRRMGDDGAVPGYWRLAARHAPLTDRPDRWVSIVRALAILTPKGAPEDRPDLHDKDCPLGEALCTGGDRDWPGANLPRPMLSERRLAQLMAARGKQRTILLTRAIRALAASKPADAGIRVPDIARAFLDSSRPDALAAPYYRRLDCAERDADTSKDMPADA
ncbi:type I-E CRISPR-associated protein Cse2/CasB [Sedimentitalea sp. JM2-8]|uniref:Type I-E CRISPR-associated protein Cse2/CasB n=1 Tax=Sedimentitalea xiamensis TaxID=3050037 RepID=A0ABT7FIR5_9RHOB|nr:type I-E CRISPR-associated protein Cse2/CasB [Sedimentitalea xiamensis]